MDGKLHIHASPCGIYVVCLFQSVRHRFGHDEENSFRFEGQRKESWIYKRPAWLIVVREMIGCDTSS